MLQISKGECQFLFDLLREIRTSGVGYTQDKCEEEIEQGIELLDEILQREDEDVEAYNQDN